MRVHSGEFLNIHYETTAGEILIRSIEPHPETYLRAGADHLISDLTRFRRLQLAVGISEVVAIPDRSATRLTLEEAGWRGAEVMRFAPDLPVPVPNLDMGRPGAFAPDTLKIKLSQAQASPLRNPALEPTTGANPMHPHPH